MNISEFINNNISVLILSTMGAILLLFILLLITMVKYSKLNKKYKKFMSGANGENLESEVLKRFADIDLLKEETKRVKVDITKINENLLSTYQKVGIIKYDAFREMGGKLSFVLALLDKNNSGFILNSVHSSREGCYIYLKEIIKGESFLELSEDEKKALDQAKGSSNFMD
ncbi:MAG: putative rane protein [Clostridiaceae bacterium]|jgi:hypothetical protein|nr:putative rane protein [Clostridiaceae bacterium]